MDPSLKVIRRAKTKIPVETNSPTQSNAKLRQFSSTLKGKTPSFSTLNLTGYEIPLERRRLAPIMKSLSQLPRFNESDLSKAKELEELLERRINQTEQGLSKWKNELEVVNSIYTELMNYLHCFSNLLQILKSKMKACIQSKVNENYIEHIESLKRENKNLVIKLNSLDQLYTEHLNENSKLKEKHSEYQRLFDNDPNFIINYQNIVEQMLKLVDAVHVLKKENKDLKKMILKKSLRITYLENKSYEDDRSQDEIVS